MPFHMVPSYSGTHVIDVQEIAEAMADFAARAHRLLDGRMRLEGLSLARYKPLCFIAREQPVRSVAGIGDVCRTTQSTQNHFEFNLCRCSRV